MPIFVINDPTYWEDVPLNEKLLNKNFEKGETKLKVRYAGAKDITISI